jgi:hypothetical protein
VILALALAPGSSSKGSSAQSVATAFVSVTAPTPSPAVIEPCAQVLSALPVQLDGLNPRKVAPAPDSGAPVVAWGDPAIVLQCGVTRPKELTEGSSALVVAVNNVNWLPVTASNSTTFIAIDRAVYIAVTVPKSYAQPPLATLSTAIAGVLPQICSAAPDGPGPSATPTGTASALCVDRS